MTCDGCGEPDADCYLLFNGPLGLTGIHVHRLPDCANTAREKHGGGTWLPREKQTESFDLPPSRSPDDERLLAAVHTEAARLKHARQHSR